MFARAAYVARGGLQGLVEAEFRIMVFILMLIATVDQPDHFEARLQCYCAWRQGFGGILGIGLSNNS